MPTVDKTWIFASDNEGLADVGDSTIAVNHDTAGDGGAGTGSLEFGPTSPSGTNSERARRASTGETWETWGVPSGATVTDIQVISWQYRTWNTGQVTSLAIKMRVVDSAATTVCAAGDLVNLGLTLGAAWTAGGSGTSRAVDAGKQAAATDVRLEAQIDAVTTGTDAVDVGLDSILLRMTYTTGSAPVEKAGLGVIGP